MSSGQMSPMSCGIRRSVPCSQPTRITHHRENRCLKKKLSSRFAMRWLRKRMNSEKSCSPWITTRKSNPKTHPKTTMMISHPKAVVRLTQRTIPARTRKAQIQRNRKVIQITPQLEADISLRRLQDSVTTFPESSVTASMSKRNTLPWVRTADSSERSKQRRKVRTFLCKKSPCLVKLAGAINRFISKDQTTCIHHPGCLKLFGIRQSMRLRS